MATRLRVGPKKVLSAVGGRVDASLCGTLDHGTPEQNVVAGSTMSSAKLDPDDSARPVAPRGIERLVQAGIAIAGNVAGVGVTLSSGDPFLGAAAGAAIQQAGGEVAARLLGPREEARVGAAMLYAADRLKMLVEEGASIRTDGFFADDVDRSDGSEVVEGVLLAAQRDHEEKKLRFYGNLLAAIAVTPDIDVGFANLLIRYAEVLSYRQLCLLALIKDKDDYSLRDERVRDGDTWPQRAVLEELDELGWAKREMVMPIPVEWDGSGRRPLQEKMGRPASSQLANYGTVLHALMGLDTIEEEDIRQLADLLS